LLWRNGNGVPQRRHVTWPSISATKFDFDDLIERAAVRGMEKDLVSHDTPHAKLYLQALRLHPATTSRQCRDLGAVSI
jgi:hypothetical protein